MKKQICGMDFSRCEHENMNDYSLSIYRDNPEKQHGYQAESYLPSYRFPNRQRRVTNLFTAWMTKTTKGE